MIQTPTISAGEVLAGKYRVERVLGVGGMGVVVLAQHLQLDERVAIKFMTQEALASAEAVARFGREARAAVKIKSEHVARVSDVGTLESGEPYMVMEYLDGADLSNWLKQQGRLQIEQAVDFVLQASEAIAEAHALGIVHRDLKPANLFVVRRPDGALAVKVLDFGISKVTGSGSLAPDHSMTRTSAIMGSPLYMSPEQMRAAKEADTRSDIWALGIILYELLTGVTPFDAEAFPELIMKIATEAPPPMRRLAPETPPGLEAAIFKCLDKDPGKRFATIGELAVALIPFAPRRSRISLDRIAGVLQAAGLSSSALVLPPSSDTEGPTAATGASWGQTTPGTANGRRTMLGLGALGAVVLIAAGVVFTMRRSSSPQAEPTNGSAATSLPSSSRASPKSAGADHTLAASTYAPAIVAPVVSALIAPTPQPDAAKTPVAPAAQQPKGAARLPAKRAAGPAATSLTQAPPVAPAAPAATAGKSTNVFNDRK